MCQVNGESVLRFEYGIDNHSETVYDAHHNELLQLNYDAAGRLIRVVPRTRLGALNVSYDRQGRWSHWTRGDLTVRRVFDESTGRLMERRLGSRTGFRYVYKNTSKVRQPLLLLCIEHELSTCALRPLWVGKESPRGP